MGVLGGLLDAFTGGRGGRDLAEAGAAIADSFTGFKVKTHSYLYQLVWNDSIAAIFYQQHYTAVPNPEKVQAFLDDTTTYRLKYVAHKYEYDEKAVLKGEYTRTELVRTICARSMDKNIVELAKQYEDFKVKTPVYQVLFDDKGRIQGYAAKIGMKEGITDTSKFQVVQRVIDPVTNKTTYKYIATVKPVKGAVWDNRYNAVLEQADGSTLPSPSKKRQAFACRYSYCASDVREYAAVAAASGVSVPQAEYFLAFGNHDHSGLAAAVPIGIAVRPVSLRKTHGAIFDHFYVIF
jgi:hypothetical protein